LPGLFNTPWARRRDAASSIINGVMNEHELSSLLGWRVKLITLCYAQLRLASENAGDIAKLISLSLFFLQIFLDALTELPCQ
jgi:hypothetical protein